MFVIPELVDQGRDSHYKFQDSLGCTVRLFQGIKHHPTLSLQGTWSHFTFLGFHGSYGFPLSLLLFFSQL